MRNSLFASCQRLHIHSPETLKPMKRSRVRSFLFVFLVDPGLHIAQVGYMKSFVTIGRADFLMNDEMDDVSIKPGFPNMVGLVAGEANAVKPGKRVHSSKTPTIVSKNGQLTMA